MATPIWNTGHVVIGSSARDAEIFLNKQVKFKDLKNYASLNNKVCSNISWFMPVGMKLCQSKQADLLFSASVRLSVHYSVPITNKVQYLKFRWGQKKMWVYFHMLKKIRVGWSAFLSPRNALLWGYSNAAVVPCVRVLGSVRPCVDLVNTIETTPLRVSLSNLSDMLTMMRGWTLLILEVKGQGHNGHIWK